LFLFGAFWQIAREVANWLKPTKLHSRVNMVSRDQFLESNSLCYVKWKIIFCCFRIWAQIWLNPFGLVSIMVRTPQNVYISCCTQIRELVGTAC